MQRALIWLNLYSHEVLRHKLKNGLKTQKMHILPVFGLMLDSLTDIQVEPHQCPLHQSILLTQGPIHEIMAVIAQLLGVVEKLSFFESAILKFFCKKNFFLLHSYQNQSTFKGQQGFFKILMITLVSRKFLVCLYFCNTVYVAIKSKQNWEILFQIFLAFLENLKCTPQTPIKQSIIMYANTAAKKIAGH